MKKTFGQYVAAIIGAIIIGFGVSRMAIAGFGLDAFNSLIGNLVTLTGLNFSIFSLILGIVFVVLNAIVNKKRMNIIAIGLSYIIGFSIDIFIPMLTNVLNTSNFAFRGIWFVLGILVYGFGVAVLITSDILSPLEEYMMAIKKITNTSVAKAKFISDFILVILALVVGILGFASFGQIGVGTLIITFVMGKVIDLFLKLLKKIEKKQNPTYKVLPTE